MRKSVRIVLIFLLAFSLYGCSNDGLKEKRLQFSFDKAEYLIVDNGKPDFAVRIVDKDTLEELANEFNAHKYVNTSAASDDDYIYKLEWYDNNDQIVETLFIIQENGYKIRYNGNDYKVGADQNIDTVRFRDLFE